MSKRRDNRTHTDAVVRSMLSNPALWIAELREAAAQRGCQGTSVADIADVINWLRANVRPS